MSLADIGIQERNEKPREDHWIPLADIMTALMMMFLLIAIVFMMKVEADADRINRIAVVYDEIKTDLFRDLEAEFKDDLPRWGANIDKNLTIRFNEPSVLFDTGKDDLKPRFIQILNNFFPRYVKILSQSKYRSSIEEIRIEGHTSSIWNGSQNTNTAYFMNMALSQSRTRSVLQHVLLLPVIARHQEWLVSHLTANGLSSSKRIINSNGVEDVDASQRVEFRIRTNADARLDQILRAENK